MSIWTHVAGVIRIDGIYGVTEEIGSEAMLDRLVGKVLDFNDELDRWHDADEHPEEFMPLGCEGSLKRSLWINPHMNAMARYTLSVFGDLRDYHDVNAVVEWFRNRCRQIHRGTNDEFECMGVRNAVITVECDDGNWAMWSSDGCDEHYLANTR